MFSLQDLKYLDYIGVAIAVVQAKDGKIVKVNSQMIELTSYDRDELESMSLTDFFSAEDAKKLLDLVKLEPNRPDQTLSDFDFLLKRKSRRKLSVSLAVRKISARYHIVTVQDNTLMKEAEWQLANAQSRLVEGAKFKALGEMAGGIAHEINNPLAIIAGLSETLIYLSEDEKIRQVADKITKTTHRISNIISGLKTMSRDSSNDQPVPCELGDVLNDTLEFCKERFRNHSIEVRVSPIPKDWLIEGRPTQLSQVILNLLNNAFDAIKDLPEKWIRIEGQQTAKLYQIIVTDSGGGIPKRIQKKIMQPFFTTKEVGRGTGLGLSISKGILEAHNGRLQLNEKNQRTQFVMSLPKFTADRPRIPQEPVAQPAAAAEKRKKLSAARTHVLVVEDEKELLELVARQLERRGFQVLTASSGKQALAAVKNNQVDVVLSDIRMADGDGFWLLDQINQYTNHSLPFIFVTGSVAISIEEAYHLGAGAVFFKPIRFPALTDTILQMTTPRDQIWSQRLPRIDVEMQVTIQQGKISARENLINLGRGGMFIAIDKSLPKVGETVKFEFNSGIAGHPRIAGTGIVRWVRSQPRNSQPAGIGIEFLYIEEHSRKALFDLINSICTFSYIPNQLDQDD